MFGLGVRRRRSSQPCWPLRSSYLRQRPSRVIGMTMATGKVGRDLGQRIAPAGPRRPRIEQLWLQPSNAPPNRARQPRRRSSARAAIDFWSQWLGDWSGDYRAERYGASQVIQGHRQLIERAHSRGLRIFGCTLTPVQGSSCPVRHSRSLRPRRRSSVRPSMRGSAPAENMTV